MSIVLPKESLNYIHEMRPMNARWVLGVCLNFFA